MYRILVAVLIAAGLLQVGLSPQVDTLLKTAGQDAQAIGFLLFAPIIELSGGILLLFAAPSVRAIASTTGAATASSGNDPYIWANQTQSRWVGNQTIQSELGPTTRSRLLGLRDDFLERKDQIRGFGFISVGFFLQILALFWPGAVPASISGLLTLGLAGYLIWVQTKVRPREEGEARSYAESKAIN